MVTRLDLSRSLSVDRSRAVTWLDLLRSLARSPYSAQNDLSQSLRSLSPRGVDVSFCRHPIDESSLNRRILTRPTSCHSTVLSSLDRRVVTRPTSRHSIDESSLDRRVLTRPTSRHSTDESSLDRRVVTRPFCRHSTVLSSLDRSVVTRRRAFSRSRSTRSAQSLGSISRGHSLVLFTRRRSISRSRSDLSLLVELTCRFSNKDSLRRIHI